jgi:hypothetical protein
MILRHDAMHKTMQHRAAMMLLWCRVTLLTSDALIRKRRQQSGQASQVSKPNIQKNKKPLQSQQSTEENKELLQSFCSVAAGWHPAVAAAAMKPSTQRGTSILFVVNHPATVPLRQVTACVVYITLCMISQSMHNVNKAGSTARGMRDSSSISHRMRSNQQQLLHTVIGVVTPFASWSLMLRM